MHKKMQLQQQIQSECSAAVCSAIIRSSLASVVGLGLISALLLFIAPLEIASVVIIFRLTSLIFTHFNASRIQKALQNNENLSRHLRIFNIGVVYGAISWISIPFAISPADLISIAGVGIIIVMTLGLAMISLTFAPMPKALILYLSPYLAGVSVYIAMNADIFGWISIGIVAASIFGVLSAGQGLSRLARATARTNAENVRLSFELQRALEKAELLLRTDVLTGLANRLAFEEFIKSQFAQHENGVLIILDLDHFKQINDQSGHSVGDDTLRAVGQLLHSMTTQSPWPQTMAARIGGEEFSIFLPNARLKPASLFADRLRTAISRLKIPKMIAGQSVSASFGIAERNNGETIDELAKRADTAMYRAKNSGRNKVLNAA